jgi:phospholipase C
LRAGAHIRFSQLIPRSTAVAAVVGLAFAAQATGAPAQTAAPVRHLGAAVTPASPIKHVVVLYQENHSFDNVLGQFCASSQRCDGATTGKLANGTVIPLATASDVVPQIAHTTQMQTRAIAGGKMDGFSNVNGCRAAVNYACYSQYEQSQIPNLWALASEFAVSDRTFEMAAIPSFGAHVELVAQQLDGFTGDNPVKGTVPSATGWGCDSFKDAPWRASPQSSPILVPACVPAPDGSGPYRSSPVQWVPTIMDRLDAAGINWRFYAAPSTSATRNGQNPYNWAICPIFAECLNSQQSNNVVPTSQILGDANAGTLPSFSILLPDNGPSGPTSQHNGASMLVGDDWIGQVVSAIANGPDWSSTAIFITYDDCGCFYDHVAPPAGLGIRVPIVIVSPYAVAGSTDSTVATFASMLAFTEHLFGLQPLSSTDGTAYDYSNSFNFAQTPLPPPAMVRELLSPKEAAYLRANPTDPDDPT